jgi:hypothetical protein
VSSPKDATLAQVSLGITMDTTLENLRNAIKRRRIYHRYSRGYHWKEVGKLTPSVVKVREDTSLEPMDTE